MARVRKPQPTLEAIIFATPEQKVLRLLLSEPTTSFTPRVISSKLTGVRGLGGGEGLVCVQFLQLLGFGASVAMEPGSLTSLTPSLLTGGKSDKLN